MIKKFISYYKPYRGLFFTDLIVATIATFAINKFSIFIICIY